MIKLSINTTTVTGYSIDVHQYEGQDYIVVPVVMMVEGVHSGSAGPLLYTAQELSDNVQQWNGRPVTINHPSHDGQPVSANEPSQLENRVGYIFGAHMEGDKLKAQAWINVNQIQERSPATYQMLQNGEALQVSIGAFSANSDEPGDWNGEMYIGTATSIRPDHLALLPNEEGACNWDDGCGIRTNSKGGNNEMNDDQNQGVSKELLLNNLPKPLLLVDNEDGYKEVMTSLQDQLDQLDSRDSYYYLEEVYNSDCIYCIRNSRDNTHKYYKASYTVNEDGSVTIDVENAEHVRKKTSYESVPTENKRTRTKFSSNTNMNTNNAKPCAVDSLIANAANNYTEEDRAWLSELPLDQFERIVANSAPAPTNGGDAAQGAESEANETIPVANSGINLNGQSLEDAVKGILKNNSNPESLIDEVFPEELGRQMKSGLATYRKQRKAVIDGIVANSDFTAEELDTYQDDALEKIHKSVTANKQEETSASDYSFQGFETPIANSSETSEEVDEMVLNSMVPSIRKDITSK